MCISKYWYIHFLIFFPLNVTIYKQVPLPVHAPALHFVVCEVLS